MAWYWVRLMVLSNITFLGKINKFCVAFFWRNVRNALNEYIWSVDVGSLDPSSLMNLMVIMWSVFMISFRFLPNGFEHHLQCFIAMSPSDSIIRVCLPSFFHPNVTHLNSLVSKFIEPMKKRREKIECQSASMLVRNENSSN